MKLKYLQENQLFELVGGSRKSKASLFVVFVVVVVAAAHLELRSPTFKVISRVFGGTWKETFNSSKFLQLFMKFKQGTHHYGTAEAGSGYRGLRLRILMEVIFSWVLGFQLWVFQTPQKYRRRKRTSVSPLQKPESPAVHDF